MDEPDFRVEILAIKVKKRKGILKNERTDVLTLEICVKISRPGVRLLELALLLTMLMPLCKVKNTQWSSGYEKIMKCRV